MQQAARARQAQLRASDTDILRNQLGSDIPRGVNLVDDSLGRVRNRPIRGYAGGIQDSLRRAA